VNVKIRNVDIDDIRNLSRLAADLNLANDLLEHTLVLANAERLTGEMQRHGDLNLLTLDETRKIGMNQAATHRIDLSVVKHDFACAETLDINGKDRVSSCFRAQDSRQIAQGSNSGNRFRAAAVNRDRDHSVAPDTPGIILSATLALLCLDLKLFFLRHDFSSHTFSDQPK
jgi:hypothetical protein